MKILFISYAAVSLHEGQVRSVAMLRALVGAGYHVDLLAPIVDVALHANIHKLLPSSDRKPRCGQLRGLALRAMGRGNYDAVHAVDEAVFFAYRLCQWKKIPLVYDAARCFTGSKGIGLPRRYRLFPAHFHKLEIAILERAACVFSSCSVLTADLAKLSPKVSIMQLEDIPIQPLFSSRDSNKTELLSSLGTHPSLVVVACCAVSDGTSELRNILLTARKVVDAAPEVIFFFKVALREQAQKLAANLDISDHCVFIANDEPQTFISALDLADAVLLVPQKKSRYIHPQVYTLLNTPAPLVAIHDPAYDELLTEKTAVRVLPNSDAMSEGILRTVHEPLFSRGIATEGQRLMAAQHTFSSFKHQVRMAYHKLFKQE